MLLHPVVDQLSYPFSVFVYVTLGSIVVLCVLRQALQIALERGQGGIRIALQLLLDRVDCNGQLGEVIVIGQLISWREREKLRGDIAAAVKVSAGVMYCMRRLATSCKFIRTSCQWLGGGSRPVCAQASAHCSWVRMHGSNSAVSRMRSAGPGKQLRGRVAHGVARPEKPRMAEVLYVVG